MEGKPQFMWQSTVGGLRCRAIEERAGCEYIVRSTDAGSHPCSSQAGDEGHRRSAARQLPPHWGEHAAPPGAVQQEGQGGPAPHWQGVPAGLQAGVHDRLPKVRQRLHRAAEYRRGIDGCARNNP
ncbi:hypothetical protein HaLaN_19291 [Haematococcus lacustris]|uniref:Uncharacterized protein n=1 Tax=Haematococcus lacustris TaxID=44745 RepID=A0A699ZQE2_HAELA|nr:hypothetical protein HaLaN_19291 [Haematococcus lacustris]